MPRSKEGNMKAAKKTVIGKKVATPRTETVTAKGTKTKEATVKKTTKKAQAQGESSRLSAPVFDITGHRLGQVTLPKETFGGKINEELMAQAVRIYFANRHPKMAFAKTRSEVKGGGRKPWRQKGTGRARAGSTRSPLWVGGGITFGPKPNDKKLKLSKKMKKRALVSALSQKAKLGEILVVSNLEKLAPKTKMAVSLLQKLKVGESTLLVLEQNKKNIKLAMRNIPDVNVDLADSLNAYEVLSHKNLMFEKLAIAKFQ